LASALSAKHRTRAPFIQNEGHDVVEDDATSVNIDIGPAVFTGGVLLPVFNPGWSTAFLTAEPRHDY
jgi:hypothetical protein